MDETKTLVAFDFGEKRIGTAIGQTVTRTATPLETIRVRGRNPDWSAIDRLVATWNPDALVVGLPLNMDGTDQWITARARRFANRLHARSGLPVHLADERLSTREAWTRLIESGSRRTGPDPVAAQVILESWFAEHGAIETDPKDAPKADPSRPTHAGHTRENGGPMGGERRNLEPPSGHDAAGGGDACRIRPDTQHEERTVETRSPTFGELARSEQPFVLPGAHDGLSARLIEQAGFRGMFVGGFASIGARHAMPDIGLMGLADISAVVRDVRAATTLPMMVDADDGYGDAKNVAHTVHTYERLGVQAIFMEDQVSPKRCGHLAGKTIVSAERMSTKIRAAVAVRDSLFIVARTDARSIHGLDEALRRGEHYLEAGADAIYVESPTSEQELAHIGRAFGALNMASMLEGGKTPIMKPADLHAMGYNIVIYGITLLMRITRTMQLALEDLRSERLELVGSGVSFEEYMRIVDLDRWSAIETRFDVEKAEAG